MNELEKWYRTQAINTFARDLSKSISQILEKCEKPINISFIPESKAKKDPNYTNRFELVCEQIKGEFQDKVSLYLLFC